MKSSCALQKGNSELSCHLRMNLPENLNAHSGRSFYPEDNLISRKRLVFLYLNVF